MPTGEDLNKGEDVMNGPETKQEEAFEDFRDIIEI